MGNPIVHGPGFSTYVRTVRMALQEKGVQYEHNEFNFLEGMPQEQLDRHPFGKVPGFEHDGFQLYETFAICRYVDEAFAGPALQPTDVRSRARMTQIICVLDSYTYGPMVGTLVIQRLVVPKMGGQPDEEAIADALPKVKTALGALENLLGSNQFLAGDSLSLADLHLIPQYTYLSGTPESADLLANSPNLRGWWERVNGIESAVSTMPNL